MAGLEESASAAKPAGKLKVFISYSRKDSAFAMELLDSLELLGFEAFLDKQDIAPGEPWEDRLGGLIRISDTVVFVISPNSIASKHCGWEVQETLATAKRLVPVVLAEVPGDQVPAELRRLNYVYFSHGRSFAKGLAELAEALRANIGWIREHTRLAEMAQRWKERGKLEPLLLRDGDLAEALAWEAKRPEEAPQVTALQNDFIRASEAAAAEALRQKASLRWRVQIALGLATVLSLSAAIAAGVLWRQADSARKTLAARNEELTEANFRLQRPISLRVAPLDNRPYDLGSNWYRAATTYTGAVAYLVRNSRPSEMFASGAILDASKLNPSWKQEPVFVTAIYAVSRHAGIPLPSAQTSSPAHGAARARGFDGAVAGSENPKDVSIMVLTPAGEFKRVPLTETIWQSNALGISINRFSGALPKVATSLDSLMTNPSALEHFEDDMVLERPPYIQGKATFLKPTAGARRPLISAGNLYDRPEVTLLVHHHVGNLRFDAKQAVRWATDLVYTEASLPGSAGSPIFDVATGQLVGFHLLGESDCPSNPSELERRVGQCLGTGTSVARIVAAIADDLKGN